MRGAEAAQDDPARRSEVVDAFLAAARDGDFDGLLAVLDPDVRLRADAAAVAASEARRALGAPPLNDGSWLYGGSTLDVRQSIATGRNGVMPPFGERLEPAQIRMLVGLLEQQRSEASE